VNIKEIKLKMSSEENENERPKVLKKISKNYTENKKILTTANIDEPCLIFLSKTKKFAIKIKEMNIPDNDDKDKFVIGFFTNDLFNEDNEENDKSKGFGYFPLLNSVSSEILKGEPVPLKKNIKLKKNDVIGILTILIIIGNNLIFNNILNI
jgi:hypothetical protein